MELAQSPTLLLVMPVAHRYGRAFSSVFFNVVICRAFMFFFYVSNFA